MNTLKRVSAYFLLALVATLIIITVLNVRYAHGWGERIDNPHFLTIIACRSQIRTHWESHERPIPGVEYRELWTNEDGEHECQRAVVDVVPRALETDPSDLSENHNCSQAAMSFAPLWEQQNKGWVVVKVGCPKPFRDAQGNILGYYAPGCPRNMKCKFDRQEI